MTDADLRAREREALASPDDRWTDYRRRLELVRAGRGREAGIRRGDRVERLVWHRVGYSFMRGKAVKIVKSSAGEWEPEGVLRWVLRATPTEILVGNKLGGLWATFRYEPGTLLPLPSETEELFFRAYPEARDFANAKREVIAGQAIRLVEPARPDVRVPRNRRESRRTRSGIDRWCPICETWSLWTPSQKRRSRRAGKKRPRGDRLDRGFRMNQRECFGTMPYDLAARKFPEQAPKWDPSRRVDCPGPRHGQDPSRPPLAVIEERINVLVGAAGPQQFDEIAWLRRLLATALRRAGKAAHECRSEHLYPWARTSDAGAVLRCRVCNTQSWEVDLPADADIRDLVRLSGDFSGPPGFPAVVDHERPPASCERCGGDECWGECQPR